MSANSSPSSPRGARVVVYSRVSTDAQEQDGTSLETQERAGIEHARSLGWTVAECIRDTASGFTLERPGIERVRELIRTSSIDAVVAYAVGRLSREQYGTGVLFHESRLNDVALAFVTERFEDNAMGKVIMSLSAFGAEFEREQIRASTHLDKLAINRLGAEGWTAAARH